MGEPMGRTRKGATTISLCGTQEITAIDISLAVVTGFVESCVVFSGKCVGDHRTAFRRERYARAGELILLDDLVPA